MLDGLWVETKDTEVVNRIAIHGICVHLLVVVEDNEAPERSSTDNMPVGQNITVTDLSAFNEQNHQLEECPEKLPGP
jgi:hypothetical protein